MIEGLEKRVVIVGAGPIGLYASYLIKKNNPDIHVIVLEEHNVIGEPTCCAGHISIYGFNKTKLSKLININSCLLNKINGANIIGPSGSNLLLKTRKYQTYVIDRRKFDNLIFKLAEQAGVEVLFNCRVDSIKHNKVEYVLLDNGVNKNLSLNYTILIGADGPNSIVRKSMTSIDLDNSGFIQTYQIKANGNFNDKLVSVYYNEFAKDFFCWIVPNNNHFAKIGLGTKLGINPKNSFMKFIKKYDLNLSNIRFDCAALIPLSKTLDHYVEDNKVIIGDAACFVKSISGGGINFGLKSAEILSKAIDLRFKKFKSLKIYDSMIFKLKRELKLHHKLYNFLLKNKTKSELDDFLKKCRYNGIESFLESNGNIDYLSSFIFKVILYPKLFIFLKDFLDFLKIK